MKKIHYVKIHNFKVFGEEETIELDQPTVLIGPNNSGKTTTLQALALWSIGIKRWYEAKGSSKGLKNLSSGINRLEIIQVPVQEARYFWKNTEIRKGSTNYIPLDISVGLEFKGIVEECKLTFTHYTPEVIYCSPDKDLYENKELLSYASSLNIEILYPMSGITTEETLLPEGRINVLIGEGKTAEVLRNLCYQITEKDKTNKTKDWDKVKSLVVKLFHIELIEPFFNKTRGSIELKYRTDTIKNPLDISASGRGQQQMLLLIAYIFAHKNSIILLDEPDAHLEILRQKQVFTILRELADKNSNQIIMATHSEVILEEAADTNLIMLMDGNAVNLAEKKDIKAALKNFGIEHYYKAKLKKSIFYIEGSTDWLILKEFAKILQHNAFNILDDTLNYYYTQNSEPYYTIQNELEIKTGYFEYYKKHFFAIKSVVPEFRGLAIFDSDGKTRKNEIAGDLITYYWNYYEIENYFVRPQTVLDYVIKNYSADIGPLFATKVIDDFKDSLNGIMLEMIFNNNHQALSDFLALSPALQETFWVNNTRNIKLSLFLENIFKDYSERFGHPILLNKGQFYEIVKELAPSKINPEITKVLDMIVSTLNV
jgi:predicted ATPase